MVCNKKKKILNYEYYNLIAKIIITIININYLYKAFGAMILGD